MRSAFGLQGQKCSACSRVYIEEPVYDELVAQLVEMTNKLIIGDPTDRAVYLGPVVNKSSYQDFKNFTEELSQAGTILTGGKILTDGEYAKGYFCQPTLVADLPLTHRLWKQEMFLPITTLAQVKSLEEAMQHANDVNYGLTAGFYGSQEETEWFFDNIEAGVTYANRPQGATTGAWPGFQPFGGWKGSGSAARTPAGIITCRCTCTNRSGPGSNNCLINLRWLSLSTSVDFIDYTCCSSMIHLWAPKSVNSCS